MEGLSSDCLNLKFCQHSVFTQTRILQTKLNVCILESVFFPCFVLSPSVCVLLNFSNGGLDPWSAGGVTENITHSLVSILIPEGAHHLDLRYSNDLDPPSVRAARALELKYFQTWIKQYQKATGRATTFKNNRKLKQNKMNSLIKIWDLALISILWIFGALCVKIPHFCLLESGSLFSKL